MALTEAKSRVNTDLRESLTGNNKTQEPSSIGAGLVSDKVKSGESSKLNTETAGSAIKSNYGKDLITALNNNSSKLTGVAAGNRQESSESN